jgi:hypothetical protein
MFEEFKQKIKGFKQNIIKHEASDVISRRIKPKD